MMNKEKAKEIVKTLCGKYYNNGSLGSAVSSLASEIISEIDAADQEDPDAYCKEHCKGYRDTGGKCFVDGRCEAYMKNKKKKTHVDMSHCYQEFKERLHDSVDAHTGEDIFRWLEKKYQQETEKSERQHTHQCETKTYISASEANKEISHVISKFNSMLQSGDYTQEACYAYLNSEHERIKESINPLFRESIDFCFLYPGTMRSFPIKKEDEYLDAYVSVKGKRSLISVLDRLKDFKFGEKVKVQIIKDNNND